MKFVIQWWKDLSVAKKLFAIVGTMAILIAIELFTLLFAMRTLSSVRAFVAGEGLWSKAQRDAVYSLQKYTADRDIADFRAFQKHLSVNLGDRRARLALEQPQPDRVTARQGFLEGQIEPQEIDGMIDLLIRFHENFYLARALEAWRSADNKLDELIWIADDIHREIEKPDFTRAKIKPLLAKVDLINVELTVLENEFSTTLGEGSRWMEKMLMLILVLLVITVEGIGLTLTAIFSRGLLRDLRAINSAAVRVGQGDFNQVLPVRSQDELGRLSESVNKMIQDLKVSVESERQASSANEAKSMFLANMSHEIRTPLSAILGFSELLRDPNLHQSERERYTEIIMRTGQNLTSIVNDILDLSKIEAGHLEIEKKNFSLTLLLSDLYTLLSFRASQKNLSINFLYTPSLPDLIHADPVRLRQILMNVVGNAIKFTDSGKIDLICSSDGRQLHFKVRDTGVGISLREKAELFQPFSQGDQPTSTKREGTGLGLILSRKLAAAMNGNVELIESHPGQGSEFHIRIGYETAAAVPARDPTEPLPNLEGKSVLVVEDSLDNQMLVQLTLSRTGAQVELASNGDEGVKKAVNGNYDVIIMDMQMPIMDGYTATKSLRDSGYGKPIIALTAFAMKEDRDKCLRYGCTDYMSKPIDLNTLIRTVHRYSQKEKVNLQA